MIEIIFPDRKLVYNKVPTIRSKTIEGKPCLVFHSNETNDTVVTCNSIAERDDYYHQIRERFKTEGLLHEMTIKLKGF